MRPSRGGRGRALVGALAGPFTSHCHLNGHWQLLLRCFSIGSVASWSPAPGLLVYEKGVRGFGLH